MLRFSVALVGLVCFVSAPLVEASGQPPDEEAQIDRALIEARDAAQLWHWSWIGLFGGGLATQGVLAVAVNDTADDRRTTGLAAIPPAVGLSLHLINHLEALGLDDDLSRVIQSDMSDVQRLDAKRQLLRVYAESEGVQRNWFAHAGPLFLNAAIAGIIWWSADDPLRAAIQFGVGIALSEARIWTSPQVATNARRATQSSRQASAPRVLPIIGPGQFGLALRF